MRQCMTEKCDRHVEFSLWVGWPKRHRYACERCAYDADKRVGLVDRAVRIAQPLPVLVGEARL